MSIKIKLVLVAIFTTATFFAQNQKATTNNPIIKLPLTIEEGYSGLTRWGGKLDWERSFNHPTIAKTIKPTTGIPKHWVTSYVNYVFLDYKQWMYQNYKAGNMTAEEFTDLVEEPSQLPYSEKWIQCIVSIAVGKTAKGAIEYIIDSNNNHDYGDDKVYTPQKKEMFKITDKEIAKAPSVNYQLFLNGKVVDYNQKIMICENKGGANLTYNFPYFYKAELNNTPIYLSSWFNGPALEKASLKLTQEVSDNPFDAIELGNIIEIEGKKYTNRGVDVANNKLRLELLPDNPNIESPTLNFKAPNFEDVALFDSDETVSLSDYKGKYVFIEFWGSWCAPCIKDLPDLKEAYDKTDRSKIAFLSIAFNDSPENLRATLEKKGIEWPQIFDGKDTLKKLYNVTAAPSSFLVNPDGKIIALSLRGAQIVPFLDKSGQ